MVQQRFPGLTEGTEIFFSYFCLYPHFGVGMKSGTTPCHCHSCNFPPQQPTVGVCRVLEAVPAEDQTWVSGNIPATWSQGVSAALLRPSVSLPSRLLVLASLSAQAVPWMKAAVTLATWLPDRSAWALALGQESQAPSARSVCPHHFPLRALSLCH